MSKEASTHIIRKFIIDVILIGILTAGIYITQSVWVKFERGFFCGDETLMFPYKDDTVTVPVLRIVGLGLPIFAFLVCEWILLRKETDNKRVLRVYIPAWVRGFYCPLASFAYGACFIELITNIAKNVIGRPRPHFFDLCKPSVDCSSEAWQKRYIQPNEYKCLGENTEKFTDMHMSFLSGHSSWAAFTMFYLAFYLEKRMVWRGTRVLRHTLQFAAVMLSWFTALSRVSDFKHHWSDVLAGYFVGLTLAVLVWIWGTDIFEPKKEHKAILQQDLAPLQDIKTYEIEHQ
ncbi:putative phosphatidate phosphatase [Melitaea cinxia]|uniref:putative phosphatidate phosphatase n=1 Tax=Melitaea cinxia TaxID=113334 RepID=UPI001E2724BD|nr:putative phosphatidate phosphatase [Melitaea cinxia]